MKASDFSGVHACLCDFHALCVPLLGVEIRKDHEVLYREMLGTPRQTERFFIYSMTKPVTAATALCLVDEGRLNLDAPVADYLPEYARLLVRDGDKVVPAKRTLTVRHLLTMTGGYDYDLRSPEILAVLREKGDAATTRDIVRALAGKPLLFEPGTRFNYGLCLDVLGGVIEVASGETLGSAMRRRIFIPLEMRNTGFDACRVTDQTTPPLYNFDDVSKKAVPRPLRNDYVFSPNYESAGAGLVGTLSDYANFADMLACGGVSFNGERILSEKSLKEAQTDQLRAVADDPSSFGCATGSGYSYSLGMRVRVSPGEGHTSPVGEFGWDGAAGAFMLVDPVNRLSITYVQHVINFYTRPVPAHARLRDAVYEALNL